MRTTPSTSFQLQLGVPPTSALAPRVAHRLAVAAVFVAQRQPAHEVAADDAPLPAVAVLEAHYHHPVAPQAAPPALVAVFGADAVARHEAVVAGRADIIVAAVAARAVEARVTGWNWVGADVAASAKG